MGEARRRRLALMREAELKAYNEDGTPISFEEADRRVRQYAAEHPIKRVATLGKQLLRFSKLFFSSEDRKTYRKGTP